MKHDPPLLSVCIITYNHAQYIQQAIESVLMQQVTFSWELIIADDFSTDGTREIIEGYHYRNPDFIKLILQEKNVGAEKNWFDLLASPKSKYIAYFEGDDYWTDPLKLQRQVDFLEAHLEYAGSAHQAMILMNDKENRLFRENVPNDIVINDIIGGRLFHTASIVFRKSAVELLINSPSVYSGDRLLNFCICILGKIRYFDECMCVYRRHTTGVSSTATVKQMTIDLNCISYLNSICPSFPKYRYMSYVYTTIGLCKNGSISQRMYYLFLSFLLSFADFPRNIGTIVSQIIKRLPKPNIY